MLDRTRDRAGPTTHDPDGTPDPEAGCDPDTDVPVQVLLKCLVVVWVSCPERDGLVVRVGQSSVVMKPGGKTTFPDLSRVVVRRRVPAARRRRDLPHMLGRTKVPYWLFAEDSVQGRMRRSRHGGRSSEGARGKVSSAQLVG